MAEPLEVTVAEPLEVTVAEPLEVTVAEPLEVTVAEPLEVTVAVSPVTFAQAAELMAELDADLGARYGADGDPVHASAEEFDGPAGQMLLATLGGEPVGCVGLRRVTTDPSGDTDRDPDRHTDRDTAELKRMYVRPGLRRRGIARALLAACEQAAIDLGYSRLWLETGTLQPEAVQLYVSAGYTPVAPFGQYAGESVSVHLGRSLPGSLTAESANRRCDMDRNGSH